MGTIGTVKALPITSVPSAKILALSSKMTTASIALIANNLSGIPTMGKNAAVVLLNVRVAAVMIQPDVCMRASKVEP